MGQGSVEDVVIREAGAEDAARLAALHVAVWRATYAGLAPCEAVRQLDEDRRRPYWQRILSSPSPAEGALLAETGDEVLGVISFGAPSHRALGSRSSISMCVPRRRAWDSGAGCSKRRG